ncbi:hypothetical protein ACOMHN_050981 [Nucella lapillus]
MKTVAPYGSWKSPISSQLVTSSGVKLLDVRTDCNPDFTDTVYWTELRSEEGGRHVICSWNTSGGSDPKSAARHVAWTPEAFSARTTVHEYGGGAYCVYRGAVYFSNFSDQGLYVQRTPDSVPEPVSDLSKKWKFADSVISPKTEVLYCIREDADVISTGAKEPKNSIVAINLATKKLHVLEEGCDFYSHPRVSPDGKKICWFQWNHPNMPWDDTEVWVAELDDSGSGLKAGSKTKMAGGAKESAIEPGWTADNHLLYVSDRSNWWNLYHVTPGGAHVCLRPEPSEMAGPQWQFGQTAYVADPLDGSRVVTLQDYKLGVMDTESPEKYVSFDLAPLYQKCLAYTKNGDAFFIGSGPDTFPRVMRFNIHQKKVEIIKESMNMELDHGYLSKAPDFIQWDTTHDMTCHGIFYPPVNKDFEAPAGTLPPVLVRAHGGPTGHFFAQLSLELQYFTSRGFAVLLVNYRGSTGHGRTYRHLLQKIRGFVVLLVNYRGSSGHGRTYRHLLQKMWEWCVGWCGVWCGVVWCGVLYFTSRGFVVLVNYRGSSGHGRTYRHLLQKMWGVYDMDDCCTGVSHLVGRGQVDRDRACIDGGSAGGYTTLACLTFRDTFKAGASHYGIGDLDALMIETHKFESRYLDGLLLPLSDPASPALLADRSPIHHTDRLNVPIALFQGDQDKIVPPNQAVMMYEAVKKKGLPCMLVMFEGEQHGFRKSENIQAALDKEFAFFGKVLGFTPADNTQQLDIANLKE